MKYLTPIAVAIAISLLIQACPNNTAISDTAIQAGVSVAVSTAFTAMQTNGVSADKIAQIKAYVCGPYANGIRSISGNPSPDNFLTQINAFVPDNIKQQYPELLAFVNPIALLAYQTAYNKYNGDITKIAQYMNDVATGLQNGSCH